MKKALATLSLLAVTAAVACAQDMVVYSFTNDTSGAATVTAPNITAGNFTGGQAGTTSAGGQFVINSTSASNNVGASGGNNAGISAAPNGLDPSTSSFFSFTLTP